MNIRFESELLKINNHTIIKVPINYSRELSSRGIVMVKGLIDDVEFKQVLEPDGKGSHFIEVSPDLLKQIEANLKKGVSVYLQQTKEWIEPEVSKDIFSALAISDVLEHWSLITPKARWNWIRWIKSTKNPKTRNKRIEVAVSKLAQGDKNPCCFDTSKCTITDISKSGVLLDT